MINKMIAKVVAQMPERWVWIFSKRYIAGKSLSDAIRLSTDLDSKSIQTTIDILGENVKNTDEILEYTNKYLETISQIKQNNIKASISLKPTMFGMLFDMELCITQIQKIVKEASIAGIFVCLDMEDSSCTERELQLFQKIYTVFPATITLVMQAYLKRTFNDLHWLNTISIPGNPINVRLCKGIYVEPSEIAYKTRKEINTNYLKCLKYMMENNFFCAIATHDKYLIKESLNLLHKKEINRNSYEFQMLYGVRPKLRDSIVEKGHSMRVYMPYGTFWFAYSMRRLKENPKMVWDIIKALLVHG